MHYLMSHIHTVTSCDACELNLCAASGDPGARTDQPKPLATLVADSGYFK
jgi:hypothetical protein